MRVNIQQPSLSRRFADLSHLLPAGHSLIGDVLERPDRYSTLQYFSLSSRTSTTNDCSPVHVIRSGNIFQRGHENSLLLKTVIDSSRNDSEGRPFSTGSRGGCPKIKLGRHPYIYFSWQPLSTGTVLRDRSNVLHVPYYHYYSLQDNKSAKHGGVKYAPGSMNKLSKYLVHQYTKTKSLAPRLCNLQDATLTQPQRYHVPRVGRLVL